MIANLHATAPRGRGWACSGLRVGRGRPRDGPATLKPLSPLRDRERTSAYAASVLIDPAAIDTSRVLVDREGSAAAPCRFEMEQLTAIVLLDVENS